MVALKRAYDPFDEADGRRVLVDRLWPRGLRKNAAHLDLWLKDIAPSDELRRWFGHDPKRWSQFRLRYRKELQAQLAEDILNDLAKRAQKGALTLVYAARDQVHNGAIVLRELIEQRAGGRSKHARRVA
jgi:uncharacterized protein YeaO (DUF488 family)